MAGNSGRQGTDRVLTVPNVLTLSRLLLLVVFLLVLFQVGNRFAACVVLAVAGTTDFFDGYVARRFGQETDIGKVLDPSVDRAVLTGAVIAIVAYGAIPIWLSIVILGREFLVSSTVLVLAALGAPRIEVRFIGKAGTFGLMVCLPLLLCGHGPGAGAHALLIIGRVLLVPSLVCSWAAAALYFPAARHSLGARGTAVVASEAGAT